MTTEANSVRIRPLALDDIDDLRELAGTIWRAHYPGIITRAQIEYMLAERYAPDVLRAEIGQDDLWWDLLLDGGVSRGYASYFMTERAGELKLDKLYVHPQCQRRGYGAMMLERVLGHARAVGCTRVILAVNKHNANAIAAYRKWGFAIEQAVVNDIGSGFVMDDFIMTRAP